MSFLSFNDNEHQLQVYNPLFDKIQKNISTCNTKNTPKIFCIDGNIGSGKSTILDELKNRGYKVFKENLKEWMPVLNLFYEDPKRWMFTLQVKITVSMKQQYDEMCAYVSEPFIFVERSPFSSLLFVKNGVRNGYMTLEEINTFASIFNQNFWNPDRVFYVYTPVDVCFQRKQKRDRQCEKDIETTYLQQLNDEYNIMYNPGIQQVQKVNGARDVKTITEEILKSCI
jgi:deoxyadenosine/deoxycytidine kinase